MGIFDLGGEEGKPNSILSYGIIGSCCKNMVVIMEVTHMHFNYSIEGIIFK